MADADFGYVGSAAGMVDLYVNYECVQRGIKSEVAVDALIDLIKAHGKWKEPPVLEADVKEVEFVGAVVPSSSVD